MRRHGLAVLLLLTAIAVAGCTDSTDPAATSPTSSPLSGSPTAGSSSGGVDPSSSGDTGGGDASLSQDEAQAALDDAIAAIDKEGSIGFESQGENVIDDKITKITRSGAWTKKPLVWTTTTTFDRPKGRTIDSPGDQTIELIYVGSTPEGPYVNTSYLNLPGSSQLPPWVLVPGYGVREGVTKKDLRTPPDLRMLLQTEASTGSALGDTLTISGTIQTSSALDVLDLTSHLGGLGFANRFEDSTTRVLVTIGADGLPQTLEFAGTNISLPGVGLPDYVAEELAGARYFVEYGDAELHGPIKVPAKVPDGTP